ncbi:hypothetical protein [Aestuariimicrobium ganziense]|uniref:hypothetical protein n=1 Tax=Aestuariimicrobium ganziense TaxID=2773677 RepID=UPI001942807D|nr:hypothetical protein [Aestuariimicrobium ganziense]
MSDDDLAELAQLHASHYVAQHADWSPAASVETMAALFAEDFTPDGDLDIAATRLAREAGAIVAAAVVWKAEAADGTTSQGPGSTIRQPGWRWWPSRCRADLHRHRCHQTSSPTRRRGCDPADRRPLGDGARQPRVRGHAKMER